MQSTYKKMAAPANTSLHLRHVIGWRCNAIKMGSRCKSGAIPVAVSAPRALGFEKVETRTIAETNTHCGLPREGFGKRKPEDLPVPVYTILLSGEKQQVFCPKFRLRIFCSWKLLV